MRADAGFFCYGIIDTLDAHGGSYSITIPQNSKVKAAIAAIDDEAWKPIAYTEGGEAQVAETIITTGRRDPEGPRKLRLIVRRSRLVGPQRELWPNWRHRCFITDRDDLDALSPPTPTTETTPESNSPSVTSKQAAWPTAPLCCAAPDGPAVTTLPLGRPICIGLPSLTGFAARKRVFAQIIAHPPPS